MVAEPRMTDVEFCAVLEAQAAACRAERAALMARLGPLEQQMRALNGLLRFHELPTLDDCLPPSRQWPAVGQAAARRPMPPKRVGYRALSNTLAIAALLQDGQTWQTDALVRAIYEIDNEADLRQARQNIVSAAHRGVAQGRWQRGSSPGTFHAAPRPPETD